MKTYQPKQKDVKRDWHLIDAKDKILGRLATETAKFLMGKHKAGYSAHMDVGDYVVVVNAKEVAVTGKKETLKKYYRHSGYPGSLKEIPLSKMRADKPGSVIELAVAGMLPKNRLRDKRLNRLKVFAGDKHTFSDKFKGKSD